MEILKKNGKWENTLILFTSDHGMAFAGGKTTVYEGGLRVPFIVRNPYQKERGNTNNAMISLVDITPTLLDFAGSYDDKVGAAKPELATIPGGRRNRKDPYKFHGRSFFPILAQKNPDGWGIIHASHTFHEIQMYYPMRVVRDRKYKLIWNIAHPLPYPFASDLWAAPSWQAQWKKGPDAPYGKKTVREYIQRPQFELFDISADPNETVNLAPEDKYKPVLEEYKAKLKKFQNLTQDPWVLKWKYE